MKADRQDSEVSIERRPIRLGLSTVGGAHRGPQISVGDTLWKCGQARSVRRRPAAEQPRDSKRHVAVSIFAYHPIALNPYRQVVFMHYPVLAICELIARERQTPGYRESYGPLEEHLDRSPGGARALTRPAFKVRKTPRGILGAEAGRAPVEGRDKQERCKEKRQDGAQVRVILFREFDFAGGDYSRPSDR